MTPREKWEKLVTDSHASAIDAVADAIERADYADAMTGLLCVVEAMSRHEGRELKSIIRQLCVHIYKVILAPNSRDRYHWCGEIENWRNDVESIVATRPSLKAGLDALVKDALTPAGRQACLKLGMAVPRVKGVETLNLPLLTLEDVLDKDYSVEDA